MILTHPQETELADPFVYRKFFENAERKLIEDMGVCPGVVKGKNAQIKHIIITPQPIKVDVVTSN